MILSAFLICSQYSKYRQSRLPRRKLNRSSEWVSMFDLSYSRLLRNHSKRKKHFLNLLTGLIHLRTLTPNLVFQVPITSSLLPLQLPVFPLPTVLCWAVPSFPWDTAHSHLWLPILSMLFITLLALLGSNLIYVIKVFSDQPTKVGFWGLIFVPSPIYLLYSSYHNLNYSVINLFINSLSVSLRRVRGRRLVSLIDIVSQHLKQCFTQGRY